MEKVKEEHIWRSEIFFFLRRIKTEKKKEENVLRRRRRMEKETEENVRGPHGPKTFLIGAGGWQLPRNLICQPFYHICLNIFTFNSKQGIMSSLNYYAHCSILAELGV